jgi:hypothetical protein
MALMGAAGAAELSPETEGAVSDGLTVATRPVPLQQAPLEGRVSKEVTVG